MIFLSNAAKINDAYIYQALMIQIELYLKISNTNDGACYLVQGTV